MHKKINPLSLAMGTVACLLFLSIETQAQQTYCYPLESGLQSNHAQAPPLIALSNAAGQTGHFETQGIPGNLCTGTGTMNVYFFEDNAGLEFDNSNGFIQDEYTIDFLFKFNELPDLFDPPWMWLIGFKDNEDDGIFLQTNALLGTYLQFWDDNTQLPPGVFFGELLDGFNTNDWYKVSLVRTGEGIVKIYWNCELLTTFDDSNYQILLPSNKIIFFQDDPSTLAAEASPGFVKDIRISNFPMSDEDFQTACNCFCDALSGDCSVELITETFTCDPEQVGLESDTFSIASLCACECDSIVTNISTLLVQSDTTFLNQTTCNKDSSGIYTSYLINQDGCDSIVIEDYQYLAPDTNYLLPYTVCPGEFFEIWGTLIKTSGTYCETFTAGSCDSSVCIDVLFADTQLIIENIQMNEGDSIEIFGHIITTDTSLCNFYLNELGCDSTHCITIEIIPSTNITENNWLEKISVFPNPTSGLINIAYLREPVQLSIHSLNGEIIFNCYSGNLNTYTFDLSHLPKGIYFISAKNGKYCFMEKIAVQ